MNGTPRGAGAQGTLWAPISSAVGGFQRRLMSPGPALLQQSPQAQSYAREARCAPRMMAGRGVREPSARPARPRARRQHLGTAGWVAGSRGCCLPHHGRDGRPAPTPGALRWCGRLGAESPLHAPGGGSEGLVLPAGGPVRGCPASLLPAAALASCGWAAGRGGWACPRHCSKGGGAGGAWAARQGVVVPPPLAGTTLPCRPAGPGLPTALARHSRAGPHAPLPLPAEGSGEKEGHRPRRAQV